MRALDPHLIADRWAAAHLEADEDGPEDPKLAAWRAGLQRRLARAMARLSADDREALRMHSAGASLSEIAAGLGVTLPSAHTRIRRAHTRLRALVALPDLSPTEVAAAFEATPADVLTPHTAALLRDYWLTANQSQTARRFGISQDKAARRITAGIACMRAASERHPEIKPLVRGLELIRANRFLLGMPR